MDQLRTLAAGDPVTPEPEAYGRRLATAAGVVLGLGLGGFFDGIVLHQLLQWHHMASQRVPPDRLEALRFNVLLDGLFHMATYLFVGIGLALLWRAARRRHLPCSTRAFAGTLLMGFGLFNLVEGIVNHQILGLHHVNETVRRDHWAWWDLGFLLWGAAMLAGGWVLQRRDRRP